MLGLPIKNLQKQARSVVKEITWNIYTILENC